VAASTLIQEPAIGSASSEIDADDLGVGPQGKPLRRERVTALQTAAFGDSVEAGTTAAAPGAAAVLATITPGAGTWEIEVNLAVVGDVADQGNCQLKKNAVVLARLAPGRSPTFRKVLVGGDTVSVVTVGAAIAGSQYTATLAARQVA